MDASHLREVVDGSSIGQDFNPMKPERDDVKPHSVWPPFDLIVPSRTIVLHATQTPLKPSLLLLGLDRSGKSSISNLVIHKEAPVDTVYSAAINPFARYTMLSFLDIEIRDYPGRINYSCPKYHQDAICGKVSAIIWVVDAQDEYTTASCAAAATFCYILNSSRISPNTSMHLFVHKFDNLSAAGLTENVYEDIQKTVLQELAGFGYENPPLQFHKTSIYDQSVHMALSKVIQTSIPGLHTLEALLTTFCSNCGIEKVFLFDVMSKLYIASDSTPVTPEAYTMCSEHIDYVIKYRKDVPVEELLSMKSEGKHLYLVHMDWKLVLTCVLGESGAEEKRASVDARTEVDDFFAPFLAAEAAE